MRRAQVLAIVWALLLTGASVQAQVTVRLFNGNNFNYQTDTFGAGVTIPLVITNQLFVAFIRADNSTIDIGRVEICSGGGTQAVNIVVSTVNSPGSIPPATGRDWLGLDDFRPAGTEFLSAHVGRNLTNSINNIERVFGFQADNQIQSSIRADDSIGLVWANSILSNVDIRSASGNINQVAALAGNMLGDVLAPNGSILNGVSATGTIGSSGTFSTLDASGSISTITSGGNMFATVTADTSLGTVNVGGDFDGSLTTGTFNNFSIGGNLDATVTLTGALQTGRQLIIGDSMSIGALIDIQPVAGLAGQIIINQNDAGGQWNGTVIVGSTSLTVPNYTNTAASLGGGSVGLATFALHDESCDPPNNLPTTIGTGALTQVKLRHYGPVTFEAATVPVTIERRPACTTDIFEDVDENDFSFEVDGTDSNSLLVIDVIGIHFAMDFEYRIQPTVNLKSDGVAGTPAVVWDEQYYTVIVKPTCPADLNADGSVNVPDLIALLTNWGGSGVGDITCSGAVAVPDLLALLARWGPCPGSGQSAPLTLEEEIVNAGLLYPEDWNIFLNCMTNGTQEEADNCNCWMDHYLNGECTGPTCHHGPCPDDDPFGGPHLTADP